MSSGQKGDAPVDLDWEGFQPRYFPGRRPRHDFQAVRAFWDYKDDGQRSVSEASSNEAMLLPLGTIETFNRSSGHGFVVPDDGGDHLWVHARNVLGDLTKLRAGVRVEFVRREAGMGAEAVDVQALDAAAITGAQSDRSIGTQAFWASTQTDGD